MSKEPFILPHLRIQLPSVALESWQLFVINILLYTLTLMFHPSIPSVTHTTYIKVEEVSSAMR